MRRSACLTVALAVVMSLTVASAGIVGATPDQGGVFVPAARGGDPGTDESADDKASAKKKQKEENCPQEKWVIALPIEGLACVLLLPMPPPEGEGRDDGGQAGGGAGSLLQ